MKFTVEIRLESGMQAPDDVARALRDIASKISVEGMPWTPRLVRDINGNTVGHYSLADK